MTEITVLMDDALDQTLRQSTPKSAVRFVGLRGCDGCGEAGSHVDLWASNEETGEELWLCESCGGR
jgi:hypothetical protein